MNRKELNLTKNVKARKSRDVTFSFKNFKMVLSCSYCFLCLLSLDSHFVPLDWLVRNICGKGRLMQNIRGYDCFAKHQWQTMFHAKHLWQRMFCAIICYKDCISKHSVKRNVLWNIFFTIMFHTQLWSLMRNFCNKKSLIHNFCDKKSLMCNFCGKKSLVPHLVAAAILD